MTPCFDRAPYTTVWDLGTRARRAFAPRYVQPRALGYPCLGLPRTWLVQHLTIRLETRRGENGGEPLEPTSVPITASRQSSTCLPAQACATAPGRPRKGGGWGRGRRHLYPYYLVDHDKTILQQAPKQVLMWLVTRVRDGGARVGGGAAFQFRSKPRHSGTGTTTIMHAI